MDPLQLDMMIFLKELCQRSEPRQMTDEELVEEYRTPRERKYLMPEYVSTLIEKTRNIIQKCEDIPIPMAVKMMFMTQTPVTPEFVKRSKLFVELHLDKYKRIESYRLSSEEVSKRSENRKKEESEALIEEKRGDSSDDSDSSPKPSTSETLSTKNKNPLLDFLVDKAKTIRQFMELKSACQEFKELTPDLLETAEELEESPKSFSLMKLDAHSRMVEYSDDVLQLNFGEPSISTITDHLSSLVDRVHRTMTVDEFAECYLAQRRDNGHIDPVDFDYMKHQCSSAYKMIYTDARFDETRRLKMMKIAGVAVERKFLARLQEKGNVLYVDGIVKRYQETGSDLVFDYDDDGTSSSQLKAKVKTEEPTSETTDTVENQNSIDQSTRKVSMSSEQPAFSSGNNVLRKRVCEDDNVGIKKFKIDVTSQSDTEDQNQS
uniref:SPK domain-containing protein n=1 Tax=Caenorhabditis tropicalis TaxID=1561998 RepID=A0A1I7TXY9_9PELO